MRRREFIISAACATAWPLATRAQQAGKLYRVGFLWDSPAVWPDALASFDKGLRERGWIPGRNIVVEYRWAEGKFSRLDELAKELVELKVDVIIAPTSIYAGAAKRATTTIPIVFVSHADPIGSGHVASLARPGGNLTGLALMMTETNAKGLELLREVRPTLSRVAVIWDPATPSHGPGVKAIESRGRAMGLRIYAVAVRTLDELDGAFATIAEEKAQAVVVLSTPLFIGGAKKLAGLALKHELPTVFGPRAHAEVGGLLAYGPDRANLFYRAANFVDQILKGAKPADLPVQQPTVFELVVNLKTARAIGVTIPESILLRADEVIE